MPMPAAVQGVSPAARAVHLGRPRPGPPPHLPLFRKIFRLQEASGNGPAQSAANAKPSGPARCQADDCAADLLRCSVWHQRNRICEGHARALTLLKGGRALRFCQQCARAHPLEAFEKGRRSCRVQLAKHAARWHTCVCRRSSGVALAVDAAEHMQLAKPVGWGTHIFLALVSLPLLLSGTVPVSSQRAGIPKAHSMALQAALFHSSQGRMS